MIGYKAQKQALEIMIDALRNSKDKKYLAELTKRLEALKIEQTKSIQKEIDGT